MREVEAVARAICLAAGLDPDRKGSTEHYRWQEFEAEAVAAIQTIDRLRAHVADFCGDTTP